MKAPLIAVLGPTASGKTYLALELAERLQGEIVNYDSVQLYRGFDIGSAKEPPEGRRGIPHHLLDVLESTEKSSAGEYARLARSVLRDLRQRERLPVMVGGTGFYLRAVLQGLFEGPGRDEELRAKLARRSQPELYRLLERLDPESAARIHPNDVPKMIRALELRCLEGRPLAELFDRGLEPLDGFEPLKIALNPPREELYARIERRTRSMFAAGLVDEVRGLLATGTPRDAWALSAVGYRQALAYLDGKLRQQGAVEETAKATRRYAKRQLTWIRNQESDALRISSFGDDPRALAEAVGRFVKLGKASKGNS